MIDVIIPTKNSGDVLEVCLKSLNAQIEPVNIIIVDANSKDNTRELAVQYSATLIDEPKKKIPGSKRALACNKGIKSSSSEIVAFLDSDTEVPHTWSSDIEKHFTDEHVGGISSGCVENRSTKLAQSISKILSISKSHAKQFEFTKLIDSCPGYNSAYRRSVLLEVGMFNEQIGGCEDWELNLRIRKAGYSLLGVSSSPVIHYERKDLKSFAKQMFGYGWSRSRLLKVTKNFTFIHAMPSLIFLACFLSLESMLLMIAGYLMYKFSVNRIGETIEKLPQFAVTFITLDVFYFSWTFGYIKGLFE